MYLAWPEHHVKPIGHGHKGQKAPYFPCLRSLCSDNKIFSSTLLLQLVEEPQSSLKKLQKVPLMAFSASLPPAPAAAPCILIWQCCCANPLSFQESLGKISGLV